MVFAFRRLTANLGASLSPQGSQIPFMRKVVDIKFPQSARLFSFCKNVLDAKFGNVRVIDQDVGQILGFDPADCSNWKKGRKHIRSIDALRAIAKHLDVDERLVMDVASGDLTDAEAVLECRGLGSLDVNPSIADKVRRDLQRQRGQAWTPEMEAKVRTFFAVNHVALNNVIEDIHGQLNFREAPLFLPEISNIFPKVRFSTRQQVQEQAIRASDIMPIAKRSDDGMFDVQCLEGTQTRPVVRFQMARVLAPFFIGDLLEPAHLAFKEHEQYMKDIYNNLFAARLLVPARLVREEMTRVDLGRDVVSQLSGVFWVSRTLMNRRLRDILSGSEF